ncbi:hypothetical protein [Phytoactinopolyspora limicola]|uniref:hypothetical protein n=1 Tax=Phytoactinopolyspora limicola TaxID=2715536 RepID=UPI00140DF282|nr:hypothetical protein [Phytoactinopolyspora limicola]
MVPLRPLGVGEILDGAVTTIRRNPRVMLGLSAAVAIVTQLVGMAVIWVVLGEAATLDELNRELTADEALDFLGTTLGGIGILLFVTWVGTVFLTGMLTVVVGRAVIGQDLNLSETWQHAKPRLPRLFGLTIVYTLVWSGAIWAVMIGTFVLAAGGNSGGAISLLVFGMLAAGLLGIWLYVRFALATPALMLETTTAGRERPQPIGIVEALRRSNHLVRNSWWRVFGILLLVLVIVFIVAQVINVPFSLPATLGDGDLFTMTGMSFGALVISTLGSVVSATITAPFSAGATALLYVDRRIRAEALDIELARAANVQLPERPEGYGPGGIPPGPQ